MNIYNSVKDYVEHNKKYYIEKYKTLNWQWYDEGLIYSIIDYASSVPIEDWTEADFDYLKTEWNFSKNEIYKLLEV